MGEGSANRWKSERHFQQLGTGDVEMKRDKRSMFGWVVVTGLALFVAALTGYKYMAVKIVLILALLGLIAVLQMAGWASAPRRSKADDAPD
jgi:hypothetical protein